MKHHHTKNKGDYGVLKAQVALYEQGFSVLTSVSEHEPFDLVAYKAGKFTRVQVKYRTATNNKIEFNLSASWADKDGNHRVPYDKNEVDVFCIYCPDTDLCYFVDMHGWETNSICLRLEKPKNNQMTGVKMAQDYLIMPESK